MNNIIYSDQAFTFNSKSGTFSAEWSDFNVLREPGIGNTFGIRSTRTNRVVWFSRDTKYDVYDTRENELLAAAFSVLDPKKDYDVNTIKVIIFND